MHLFKVILPTYFLKQVQLFYQAVLYKTINVLIKPNGYCWGNAIGTSIKYLLSAYINSKCFLIPWEMMAMLNVINWPSQKH